MTLYEILGLKPNATPQAIERAFRKLAKQFHPDRTSGDEAAAARFKDVNEAYDVLRDPERREHYDKTGEYQKQPSQEDSQVASVLVNKMWLVIASIAGNLFGTQGLKRVDLVKRMRESLVADRRQMENEVKKLQEEIGKCIDLASRFQCDGKENVLAAAIVQQKKKCEGAIAGCKAQAELLTKAEEALGSYRFKVEELAPEWAGRMTVSTSQY